MLKRVLLINGLVFSIYMMISYSTHARQGWEVAGLLVGLITGVITLLISLAFYYIIRFAVGTKRSENPYIECPNCKQKTLDRAAKLTIIFNSDQFQCSNCNSAITFNKYLFISISFLIIVVNTFLLHFNFEYSGIGTSFLASLYPYANYILFSIIFVLFVPVQIRKN